MSVQEFIVETPCVFCSVFCYQTIIEVYLLYHFFAGTSVGCVLNTNQKYGK